MHIKTMEGLVGASASMNIMRTPIRVYKEAELRGDTAVMERAMGYAGDFAAKAEEYRGKAEEGMEKEVEETKKLERETREKAIEKQKEKNEKLEENVKESNSDSVEISGEGERAAALEAEISSKGPVIYTKTGEAQKAETVSEISVLA